MLENGMSPADIAAMMGNRNCDDYGRMDSGIILSFILSGCMLSVCLGMAGAMETLRFKAR